MGLQWEGGGVVVGGWGGCSGRVVGLQWKGGGVVVGGWWGYQERVLALPWEGGGVAVGGGQHCCGCTTAPRCTG